MSFFAELDGIDDLETSVKLAHHDLEIDLGHSVQRAARRGIEAAKQDHPYTDRTHQLTQTAHHTRAEIFGEDIDAEMVWEQDYASFVKRISDGQYDFTPIAVERAEETLTLQANAAAERFADTLSE